MEMEKWLSPGCVKVCRFAGGGGAALVDELKLDMRNKWPRGARARDISACLEVVEVDAVIRVGRHFGDLVGITSARGRPGVIEINVIIPDAQIA